MAVYSLGFQENSDYVAPFGGRQPMSGAPTPEFVSQLVFDKASVYNADSMVSTITYQVALLMNDMVMIQGGIVENFTPVVFENVEVIGGSFGIKINYMALNGAIESMVSAYGGGEDTFWFDW